MTKTRTLNTGPRLVRVAFLIAAWMWALGALANCGVELEPYKTQAHSESR
jgi:hypothetical protein